MKLSQCKIGVLVKETKVWELGKSKAKIGHVVGLGYGHNQEVIPLVHFVGEQLPRTIHHTNISIYKD